MYDIRFPNLGVYLENIPDGITIFGLEIKFYGIIIASAFMLAYYWLAKEAARVGQNPDDYLDFLLVMIIPAILGARLYYVIFSPDEFFHEGQGFLETLKGIINLRSGGLAIYGGVIAGAIVLWIFTKVKKISVMEMLDVVVMGLLLGQILGRFGNFFNREAFGGYSDGLFAMAIPVSYYQENGTLQYLMNKGVITTDMIENVHVYQGAEFIQVHPTFLYEAVWNLVLLLIIIFYRKNKKFEGEIFLMYLWGYGLGRVWIEGLRSDSLLIGGMKASQLLAAACVVIASCVMAYKRLQLNRHSKNM